MYYRRRELSRGGGATFDTWYNIRYSSQDFTGVEKQSPPKNITRVHNRFLSEPSQPSNHHNHHGSYTKTSSHSTSLSKHHGYPKTQALQTKNNGYLVYKYFLAVAWRHFCASREQRDTPAPQVTPHPPNKYYPKRQRDNKNRHQGLTALQSARKISQTRPTPNKIPGEQDNPPKIKKTTLPNPKYRTQYQNLNRIYPMSTAQQSTKISQKCHLHIARHNMRHTQRKNSNSAYHYARTAWRKHHEFSKAEMVQTNKKVRPPRSQPLSSEQNSMLPETENKKKLTKKKLIQF